MGSAAGSSGPVPCRGAARSRRPRPAPVSAGGRAPASPSAWARVWSDAHRNRRRPTSSISRCPHHGFFARASLEVYVQALCLMVASRRRSGPSTTFRRSTLRGCRTRWTTRPCARLWRVRPIPTSMTAA
jgi:hypothetical protein